MRRIGLEIELLAPLIVSERSATEGSHRCLDYLPGAKLLGAAARTYGQLTPTEAFEAFHSGRLRFLDATPVVGGRRGVPVPLSWHRPKIGSDVHDLSLGDPTRVERPVQLRTGHVDGDGQRHDALARRMQLKVSRRAARESDDANAALFGYESLPAGTLLGSEVNADDDVDEALIDKILREFCQGSCFVGRSRGAEYGRVSIRRRAEPWWGPTNADESAAQRLTLLCTSDLAPRDPATGQPTLQPTSSALGLAGWRWLPEPSFLRTRRYSPFNGARRRPDLERQVITRGSVLVYERAEGASPAKVPLTGLGDWTQEGLGQVWVNSPLLRSERPSTRQMAPVDPPSQPPPDSELLGWLEHRMRQDAAVLAAEDAARIWADEVLPLARAPKAPNRSQWGQLRLLAARATGKKELEGLVADDGRLARGQSAKAWKAGPADRTLRHRVAELIRDCPEARAGLTLRLASARVAAGLEDGGDR